MAAAEEYPTHAGGLRRGEASRRDAVWRAQRRDEEGSGEVVHEEAELRRRLVVGAEAAEESGVREEAAPALADEGGAGKRGRERRQAEQDLPEDVVVVRKVRRRRRRAGCLAHLELGGRPAKSRSLGSRAAPTNLRLAGAGTGTGTEIFVGAAGRAPFRIRRQCLLQVAVMGKGRQEKRRPFPHR